MYRFVARIRDLYSSCQDNLSREVFRAQMLLDAVPGMTNILRLDELCVRLDREQAYAVGKRLMDILRAMPDNGEKLVIHGTGTTGQRVAPMLLAEGFEIHGFCSRSVSHFPDGLFGRPAFSYEWLFSHAKEVRVLVLGGNAEVSRMLQAKGFPMDRVLPYAEEYIFHDGPEQYFEFPELFPKGSAFVDGGCFDGGDSIRFAQWCGGGYSKIFAFEPDEENRRRCEQSLKDAGIRDAELIPAGMSDRSGASEFVEKATTGSFFTNERGMEYDEDQVRRVKTVKIDNVVGDDKVGMIKMDIEGAEYAALHGAARVIQRDKPLLAICIYHKVGDMPAIMDYCKRLVPEYRFWLRQYGVMTCETVMYAAI